jgi:hypothetical protein
MPSPASRTGPTLSARTADGRSFRFSRPFHIGREHDCEIRLTTFRGGGSIVVSNGNGAGRSATCKAVGCFLTAGARKSCASTKR